MTKISVEVLKEASRKATELVESAPPEVKLILQNPQFALGLCLVLHREIKELQEKLEAVEGRIDASIQASLEAGKPSETPPPEKQKQEQPEQEPSQPKPSPPSGAQPPPPSPQPSPTQQQPENKGEEPNSSPPPETAQTQQPSSPQPPPSQPESEETIF